MHQQYPEYSEDRYAYQKYCSHLDLDNSGRKQTFRFDIKKMDLSTAPPRIRLAPPPPDQDDARVLVNLDETKGKQRNAAKWTKRVILVGAQGL